jgi:hypothetical protein
VRLIDGRAIAGAIAAEATAAAGDLRAAGVEPTRALVRRRW